MFIIFSIYFVFNPSYSMECCLVDHARYFFRIYAHSLIVYKFFYVVCNNKTT